MSHITGDETTTYGDPESIYTVRCKVCKRKRSRKRGDEKRWGDLHKFVSKHRFCNSRGGSR